MLILALVLLPLAEAGSEEGMTVVPAQEILDKIEMGLPVEYDHVIVKGDLDLSKLDRPKRPVSRSSSEIQWLSLSENATIVSSPIRIIDSTIKGNVYFSNAIFDNSVNFMSSNFKGTADFRGSAFNGYTVFMGSAFNGTANFRRSVFNGTANFDGSAFNGYADFDGSAFNGTANFWGSAFNSSDFSSVQFDKLVSFDDARLNGSTSFNSSRFKEDALFEGADFNGTLYLMRTKYDRLFISWKNIKELGYDDAAYLSLLENFKKLGYLEDYDGCYYEYRRLHREQDWSGKYHAMNPAEEWFRKRIDVGLEAFYGYGKKPIWPLLWSAGTILFFGAFWRRGGLKRDNGANQRGIWERYGLQEPSRKRPWDWRGELRAIADALIFSATLFLSGTRLFVDPPQMPEVHRWSPSQAKAAFIAERVLGAFFSILFFLAISGTVVR